MSHEPPAGGPPDWYTPPEIFHALGLQFDLDPCAPEWPRAHWIPTASRLTLPVDGLAAPWKGRVWLNPPYGDETAKWVGKLAAHGDGIALVFVRTDTPWWQDAAARASAVCMIRGRVGFVAGYETKGTRAGQPGRAGAASCLIAFGDDCAAALARSELGVVFVAEQACVRAQTDLWSAAA